jgi:hypothetical protein
MFASQSCQSECRDRNVVVQATTDQPLAGPANPVRRSRCRRNLRPRASAARMLPRSGTGWFAETKECTNDMKRHICYTG